MFHARTLGRLGLWEILVKRIFILCAKMFFEFLKKKWVKMVKLFDFYGILWYFENRTHGELMGGLGTSLIFM